MCDREVERWVCTWCKLTLCCDVCVACAASAPARPGPGVHRPQCSQVGGCVRDCGAVGRDQETRELERSPHHTAQHSHSHSSTGQHSTAQQQSTLELCGVLCACVCLCVLAACVSVAVPVWCFLVCVDILYAPVPVSCVCLLSCLFVSVATWLPAAHTATHDLARQHRCVLLFC